MKKYIIALVLVATLPAFALAKKPQKAAEPAQAAPVVEEAEPTVTEECVINVSLFNESVKNKQYADAWDPWWQVYTTCPNANKAIYTRGDELVEWKISQTQDPRSMMSCVSCCSSSMIAVLSISVMIRSTRRHISLA